MLFRGFRSEFIRLISHEIRSGIWRLSRSDYPAVPNSKVYCSRFSDEIVHSSTITKISQNNHGRNFSQWLTFSWSSEPFYATGLCLYSLKTRENYWFSDFFREYRNTPVAWIRLKINFPITEKPVNWPAFICLHINTIISLYSIITLRNLFCFCAPLYTEAYSEPRQTSKMELFAKIIKRLETVKYFRKMHHFTALTGFWMCFCYNFQKSKSIYVLLRITTIYKKNILTCKKLV